MNNSVMVWFAVAALVFWSIGAHNRLMRLRSQAIATFANLERLFNQYLLLVSVNMDQLPGATHDLNEEQGRVKDVSVAAHTALVAAAEQLKVSLKMARSQPLNGSTTSALRTAFETLSVCWLRLLGLPSDLVAPALPHTLRSEWEQLEFEAEISRTDFNKTVANYNEAITQFPAFVVAWVFGFGLAQPI